MYYDLRLDNFYTKYLVYFACGKQMGSEKEKAEAKKMSPIPITRTEWMRNLNVTLSYLMVRRL